MVSALGSSSRPHGPQEGDWQSCYISHLQLSRLQTQGYLRPSNLVFVRAGLTSIGVDAFEEFPQSQPRDSQSTPSLGAYWNTTGSSCTTSHQVLFYISPVLSLFANCSWVARLTSNYGKSSSASSPAIRAANVFLKWAVPKYGV